MSVTRRRFLQTTVAGMATASVGADLHAAVPPARRRRYDEIRIAVIGVNSRGRDHIDAFSKMEGVRVVALCDADAGVLAREAKKLDERGVKVDAVTDMRRIMDRADIDAVSTATPNHWHALLSVWACQAGKDVYVEKPVSHSVWEGRQIVRAARKYNRIVQTGTQARSSTAIAEALEWVQAGNLGRIVASRGICYKPRKSIGKVDSEQQIPSEIDYDLWTGPADLRPLMRKRLHYEWHWDFETGNGDLGNQGIHQMDICRWALGERGLPPVVGSLGGRFGYDDDGNTPNTQLVWFGYDTPLIFEVRGLPRDAGAQSDKWEDKMDRYKGLTVGSVIECEGGYVSVSMDYERASAYDRNGTELRTWKGTKNHYANFIDAVRSRKTGDLAADIEEGHVSSALCHLGNISFRVGEPASREGIGGMLRDRNDADVTGEAFGRMMAHLDANGVDLERAPVRMGPWLAFNPGSERFVNSAEANGLLRRDYRAPFVIPDAV